ncbi:MAG: PQQ-dependent sugar dehydrogenase [Sandaracinus sp.]
MTKVRTIVLGGACALALAAGCDNGGGAATDAGSGTDTGPRVDTGVPPTDTGVPGEDTGTPTPDAGMTNGCELGNTFPDLDIDPLHSFDDFVVSLALAPGRDEIFAVQRGGQILIMDPVSGDVSATPFLDIGDRLMDDRGATPANSDEWGLLGLAFHPDYPSNGLFYIAYTTYDAGTWVDRVSAGHRVSTDVGQFDRDIFEVDDTAGNHNGGQLAFGPDGYLYYGVGDGGEQGDPDRRGQDNSIGLGKIHRLEVGPAIDGYNPAPGNPFIGGGGLPTIWAYGLRNPWRFSFDRLTGDFYVGDVGQDSWEEVDFVAAGTAPPINFGWSVCEGTHDFHGTCADLTGDVEPIAEYPHAGGNGSVTGGYVYRGTAIPGLRGAYLYADEVGSAIFALRNCSGAPVSSVRLTSLDRACDNPATFGEDRNGELLVSCVGARTVYRIVAAP